MGFFGFGINDFLRFLEAVKYTRFCPASQSDARIKLSPQQQTQQVLTMRKSTAVVGNTKAERWHSKTAVIRDALRRLFGVVLRPSACDKRTSHHKHRIDFCHNQPKLRR
jgi:hypothetical protein